MKKTRAKTNYLWIFVVVFLLIGLVGGGTFYWFFIKAEDISSSAFEAAKNAQTQTTPIPSPTQTAKSLAMPKEDVEGQDLQDCPRYSNSIRSYYYKSEESDLYILEYFAPELSSKIVDFYKKTLAEKGWILNSAQNNSWNFSKEGIDLTLEVLDEDNSAPTTQYKIQYIPASEEEKETSPTPEISPSS
jgi:hypothetical protein